MASSNNIDKSPLLRWIHNHLDYPHEDCCLIWPFARRSGYALVTVDGKALSVHRYICELKNGPPPSQEHVAAHSCNRGEDACVNHHHISWKTKSENQRDRADRKERGKNGSRTKLTPEAVLDIRAVATLEPIQVTADRHGVSIVTIRHVQSGKTWRGDRRRTVDLTAEQVIQIRRLRGTMTQQAIAAQVGVRHSVVHRVLAGKSYGYITEAKCE